MNLRRIRAILWQELFVLYRSSEVIADIIVFPFTNIIVFGFLSLYLSTKNEEAGDIVILGMLLWNVVWIVEYSVTLGSLWNIWSRNLTNLFISPMYLREYIFAHTLSGMIKALVVLALSSVLSVYIFDFNLLSVGIGTLLLALINLALFSYALGIVILGFIFKLGTRVQAAAWSLVGLFQPLSAAVYPLSVMPVPLQWLAALFPTTYTFEAVRYSLAHAEISWQLFGIAFAENIVYCILGTLVFISLYNTSRDTGQFARNEA